MKKIKLILLLILTLISINSFAQRTTFQCSFATLSGGTYTPVTTLTIDSLRLVCVYGTYNGYVIFPDYVTGASCTHNGNGQYTLGWFNGGTFTLPDKKYEVKLQRNIAGVWTDQPAFGYFWIGDFGENIDNVRDSLSYYIMKSDTSNNVRIWSDQTIAGNKTFTGTNSGTNWTFTTATIPNMNYYGGYPTLTFQSSTGKMWLGSYTAGTPLLNGSPLYANSSVCKSWVQSEIDTRIAGILTGQYIESPNIIRLMPNGTAYAGQSYITWSTMTAYIDGFVGYGKQLTALLCGEGTSATYITPILYEYKPDTSAYFIPYCNYRGLGSDVMLYMDGNFSDPTARFQADTLGQITIEDVYFYFDNDSQTGTIDKIVFKNCRFYSNGGAIYFTNCRFEGYNYFDCLTSNEYSFVNCIGTSLYSTQPVNVSGTNMIPYQTPLAVYTKQIKFFETLNQYNAGDYCLFRDTTNYLMFRQSSDTIYHVINDCEELFNKTTIYTLTTSQVALESYAIPYYGTWRIDIYFNYQFALDSIINWGTEDSINVYIDYEEPASRGAWVKRIYNPYNTKWGEKGTGHTSIVITGDGSTRSGNVYGVCSDNAQNTRGAIKRYISNLRIYRTKIK